MPHPDVDSERAYLTFAAKCLDEMRTRTAAYIDQEDLAAGEFDSAAVRGHLTRRLRSLDDDSSVLCFGRIDEETGDRYYVGRREVDDPDGDPVVVDWRARIAIPFYRATAADPFGLALRRRFTFFDRELADIFEEDFTDPDSVLAAAAGGVPDPLLAELRRERTGQMRDIVATIQSEQDVVIRAPVHECLVVQGGPGTGKTAVGLHRAAFLLYEHRERLSRQGVLVVGPNRVFLEYISQVLPSLGETSVSQSTVDDLLGLRFRIVATDVERAARLKGDARLATVIARACEESIRAPESDVVLRFRARRLVVAADAIAGFIASARQRVPAFAAQRLRFRELFVRHAYELFTGGDLLALAVDEFSEMLLADRESRAALDALWRPVNPAALVKRLLTSRAALARAADGVLEPDEQQAILRRSARKGEPDPWTAADLPLLDEAEAFVKGDVRRYGHVVVDEAQDLSAMALRMIARRAVAGSLTVLGDLAQATGAGASRSWTDALEHLGSPEVVRTAELTIGYRLPAAILDFANRLLPEAAPHVTPAVSAREEGDPPELHAVAAAAVVPTVVELAEESSREVLTTAVIAPVARLDELRDALAAAGHDVPRPEETTITHRLSLLPAGLAKGLEFDTVVVVEPSEILAESEHGARLLFVALTRAVQRLVLVHARQLPVALAPLAAP
ncbi:MAG TPA: AAA family ATPase [Acidimicrobiia bacterium]|nr:AAA family ATPase [Acidimicrobiia bacterium]